MPLDFPNAPTSGQVYGGYFWDGEKWSSTGASGSESDITKVDVAGDEMTGPLVLPGDPVSALQAAPKQYVDTATVLIQAGVDPIPQSVVNNVKHQVFVTQFAACVGNDAVDDSVGINKAINYLNSVGGGLLIFNPGDQARIKNPIILKPGVYLYGMSGPRSYILQSHIRAAASLVAMVTTADTTAATHSCGLIGMVLDGNKAAFTVGAMVKIAMLNSRIENCQIENGTGQGVWCTADGSGHSWINWITGNSITNFPTGSGVLCNGTDSIISGNYISTCQYGVLVTTTSNVRVIGNHFELCTSAALLCQTPAVAANFSVTTIVGNTFTLNAVGILFSKGAFGATAAIFGSIVGNMFNSSTLRDIFVDPALTDGMVGENSFQLSTPSNGNVEFGSTNCTGWTVDGSPGMTITGGAADLKTKHIAWRAYTPIIGTAVNSGVTTSSITAAYQIDGRRCHFRGSATITAIGTASHRMTITLPVAARNVQPAGAASGFNTTTGAFLTGIVGLDVGGVASIGNTTGTVFPAAAGNTVAFYGWYEIT